MHMVMPAIAVIMIMAMAVIVATARSIGVMVMMSVVMVVPHTQPGHPRKRRPRHRAGTHQAVFNEVEFAGHGFVLVCNLFVYLYAIASCGRNISIFSCRRNINLEIFGVFQCDNQPILGRMRL